MFTIVTYTCELIVTCSSFVYFRLMYRDDENLKKFKNMIVFCPVDRFVLLHFCDMKKSNN